MGNDHLKRLAAPKTWQIKRKGAGFITKPAPGPHGLESGMPIGVLLKEVLQYAKTTREVERILNSGSVKIDGKPRKDFRFPVGIFDAVEFIEIHEYFRMIINGKGKLDLVKISKEESSIKPCKIINKTLVKGKTQLNLFDGKNIFVDKGAFKVGDSVLLELPGQKIIKHLKFGKKSTIFLTGGKHIGEIGNVEDIIENRITYKDEKGNLIETSKEYAFVIGEEKPAIKVA